MLKKVTRPYLKRELLGKGVVLEICVAEGIFCVAHDALYDWVNTNKNALKTNSWQRGGAYSWPRTPTDMLLFLEPYRILDDNATRPVNQRASQKSSQQKLSHDKQITSPTEPDPPDISQDVLSLVRIAVRHCRLPHQAVVKCMGRAVFPVIRGRNEQRGETDMVDGREIMYDDNTAPRWALLWAHGISTTAHLKGWMFAHVWDDAKNPDAYTHLANLVMLPESFGGLSDKQGPLVPYLRYHAQATYGWRPAGKDPVSKPSGYDDLMWKYLDSVPDPAGFIRERSLKSEARRAVVLCKLLGWR